MLPWWVWTIMGVVGFLFLLITMGQASAYEVGKIAATLSPPPKPPKNKPLTLEVKLARQQYRQAKRELKNFKKKK